MASEGLLAVMVGAAGSGKSELAAAVLGEQNVVSSDAMRALVCGSVWAQETADHDDTFTMVLRAVTMRCKRRLVTAVDSTALLPGWRDQLREVAADAGVPCVAVLVSTPLAECLRRNAGRERRVPEDVIVAHCERAAWVRWALPSEGFDAVLTVDGTRSPDGAAGWLAERLAGLRLPS